METLNVLMGKPLLALFAVVGAGLLLGKLSFKGVSLGSSGVLFAALLVGHWGYGLPEGMGMLGLVLFVYCVGVGAGGRFFSALAREGSTVAKLALAIVAVGCGVAGVLAKLLGVPVDLAVGIFAGALTSTPALAAASESLARMGDSTLVIGYGIAYPFGVAGVVVAVQVLPRLLKWDLTKAAEEAADPDEQEQKVVHRLVVVTNPSLFGKRISESGLASLNACLASRVMREGKLVPLSYEDCFEEGQRLLLVGRQREIGIATDYVGHRAEEAYVLDVENERQQLLATSKDVLGRSLRELAPLREHGVVITRVQRLGMMFVPNATTVIEQGDVLTVVGPQERLRDFAQLIGHRSSAMGVTDLLSLSLGLTLGMVVGMVPLGLPGMVPVTLGLAGGPLLTGLVLGHFGRVGGIVGHIPRPTRLLLQDLGLVLFLADAGVKAGGKLVETLQAYGVMLFGMGAVLTLVPLLAGLFLGLKVFRLNRLKVLGAVCGGMTSTPALGAITAKTDSQVPVLGYATAYPVALILMTVFAKVLVQALA